MEGDTNILKKWNVIVTISIHALRVEGDVIRGVLEGFITCISIHALRVEGDARACVD